jgi:hypothetical protein
MRISPAADVRARPQIGAARKSDHLLIACGVAAPQRAKMPKPYRHGAFLHEAMIARTV